MVSKLWICTPTHKHTETPAQVLTIAPNVEQESHSWMLREENRLRRAQTHTLTHKNTHTNRQSIKFAVNFTIKK